MISRVHLSRAPVRPFSATPHSSAKRSRFLQASRARVPSLRSRRDPARCHGPVSAIRFLLDADPHPVCSRALHPLRSVHPTRLLGGGPVDSRERVVHATQTTSADRHRSVTSGNPSSWRGHVLPTATMRSNL